MTHDAVARIASSTRLIAASLLAAAGVRFAVAAVTFAIAAREPLLPVMASSSPAASSAPRALPSPPTPSTEPVEKARTSMRVPLTVVSGPARSELYVNGLRVGRTPFIGEVSCKAGEPVRIEIVPPAAAPTTHTLRCAPGGLRVGN